MMLLRRELEQAVPVRLVHGKDQVEYFEILARDLTRA